jgi:hypothetical protein
MDSEKIIKEIEAAQTHEPSDYDQHVFNHYVPNSPTINAKAEKNSKGFNYEVTVIGASTPAQAAALLEETMNKLKATFEPPVVTEPEPTDAGGK